MTTEFFAQPTPATLRRLIHSLYSPQHLIVRRTGDGTLDIRIVSEAFRNVSEPHAELLATLRQNGVALPPRTLTFLRSPEELAPDEAELLFAPALTGTPTWGDTLSLEPHPSFPDDRDFSAKVVAFWGVKGGVGRSTALAHVASILGRTSRVLALDLDLDSPGLVPTLAADPDTNQRFEALVSLASQTTTTDAELREHITSALRRAKEPGSEVQVLGPAVADAAFVQALLGPLAPAALYRGGQPALRRLVRLAIEVAEAAIVLVDTRSGYCDESAMTVLDLADELVLFASPAPSTFASLAPAIHAIERNRRARGRPKIVHAVAGMVPAGEEARTRILTELRGVFETARAEVLPELDGELSPDVDVIPLDYSARIVENEGRLLVSAIEGYREVAGRVRPENPISGATEPSSGWAREVLLEAEIPAPQAEQENFSRLAQLFTTTRDLRDFVKHDVCLVLGAKGTGKSYLRRMCLEQQDVLMARAGIRALSGNLFVDGYSQPHDGAAAAPPISRDVLRQLDEARVDWSNAWSALALARALERLRRDGIDAPSDLSTADRKLLLSLSNLGTPADVVAAVKKASRASLQLDGIWMAIDALCSKLGKTLTLLFDDLDVALGESSKEVRRRGPMLLGLLDRLSVSWVARRHLAAKVFLREDIFRSLKVEEEAKYASRRIHLRWSAEEIWLLVIRAMTVASPRFSKKLLHMGIDPDRLEEVSEEQRDAALSLIWGNRMGEGESNTRSSAWVWGRLHDGAQRMFPRAALWLLRFALEERRKRLNDLLPLLDPSALRAAIPNVAKERLAELTRECTREENRMIRHLVKLDSYQDEKRFLRALRDAGDKTATESLRVLKELGLLEAGARRDGTPTVRIVDLYAYAPELEINRLGRR